MVVVGIGIVYGLQFVGLLSWKVLGVGGSVG